jgi:hypothetical protein
MSNRFRLHAPKREGRQPSFKEDLMTHHQAQHPQTTRRLGLIARVAALAVTFTVSLPQLAHADRVTPPPVPSNIQVPAGHQAFLEGHAVGTQNYICLPSGWTFFGPQATLFNDHDKQIITHFLSAIPEEEDTLRPTWQHSRDTSSVWAMPVADGSSSDPKFVAPGAIPWLLLQVVSAEPGPTGGRRLTKTVYIQRLNTAGGVAPVGTCTVGQRAFVPYEADYFFYKAAEDEEEDRDDDHDDED